MQGLRKSAATDSGGQRLTCSVARAPRDTKADRLTRSLGAPAATVGPQSFAMGLPWVRKRALWELQH